MLCGEIGLTGELRPVSGFERRLREAARLGFVTAIVPERNARTAADAAPAGLAVVAVPTLRDALVRVLGMSEGRSGTTTTAASVALKVGADA